MFLFEKKTLLKNNRNYFKKLNNLVSYRYDLFTKIAKSKIFNNIEISLYCILLADEDKVLKNNLLFLEYIAGQKGIGYGEFKYIGSTKKFFFSSNVFLRKKKKEDFLLFLTSCCLAVYYKRNGLFIGNVKHNEYNLKIVDVNIFPNFNFINVTGNLVVKFIGYLENRDIKLENCLKVIKVL